MWWNRGRKFTQLVNLCGIVSFLTPSVVFSLHSLHTKRIGQKSAGVVNKESTERISSHKSTGRTGRGGAVTALIIPSSVGRMYSWSEGGREENLTNTAHTLSLTSNG